MELSNTFRVFSSRNYCLFFTGQLVSRIGTWMQRTAVIWIVYTMSHSVLWVGFATFAEQFPSFILSPSGGIVADRHARNKVILITQTVSALQAVALAAVYHWVPNLWSILSLSFILGVANAYDLPARQAMVNDMVDKKEDLPSAIAMNASLNNFSRLFGPAIAGIVLAKLGATVCFTSNAISFIAVIFCILLMRFPHRHLLNNKNQSPWKDFKEGLRYTKLNENIYKMLSLIAVLCFFVSTYNTLQPYYAKDVFRGDADIYGYINAATGFGALISTLFLASIKDVNVLKKQLFYNLILLGVGLIVLSHIHILLLYLFFCAVCGFGVMSIMPIGNTIVQMTSSYEMRGRIVAFYAMCTMGMMPLGSLFIGWIAKTIAPQNCMLCQGIMCLAVIVMFRHFLNEKKPIAIKD